jgi:hypothetical protein
MRPASASKLRTVALATSVFLACVSPPPADVDPSSPGWTSFAENDCVSILTYDSHGGLRETTIWLIVLDDQGYIRSGDPIRGGGESWVDDLERKPSALLRVQDTEFPVTIVPIVDPVLVERAQQAFREKYGLIDRFIRWARPSLKRISRLEPSSRDAGNAH